MNHNLAKIGEHGIFVGEAIIPSIAKMSGRIKLLCLSLRLRMKYW